MKIGIITITGGANYGNRLQNYAMQEVLKNNFECEVDTFVNNSTTIKYMLISKLKKEKISYRQEKFNNFNQEYIQYSNLKINNWVTSKKFCDYDTFICGSDQIWNSQFRENGKANFGFFAANQRVISYAASFGMDYVIKNRKKEYKKYLDRIDYISVREKEGKKIIESLTHRDDVEVVLDPTLLLDKEEWKKIEKSPQNHINQNYIVSYFLGNNKSKEKLIEYAEKNKCILIDLMDKNLEYYNYDPSEFLYLIHNCKYLVTDSFHACIFALIYGKEFFVFEREDQRIKNMNSRINTLLTTFKIEDRRIEDIDSIKKVKMIDYSNVYQILEAKKKESLLFLKKSLLSRGSENGKCKR